MSKQSQAIACVNALNNAWPQGDMASVALSYHPEAVLLPPDLGPVIQGRDAIVQTYADFNASAKLETFTTTKSECFSFDSTVAVHVHFAIAYSLGSASYQDDGLDIYLLDQHAGHWVVVWRQQIVLASREQG